jgi:hypothetical protein
MALTTRAAPLPWTPPVGGGGNKNTVLGRGVGCDGWGGMAHGRRDSPLAPNAALLEANKKTPPPQRQTLEYPEEKLCTWQRAQQPLFWRRPPPCAPGWSVRPEARATQSSRGSASTSACAAAPLRWARCRKEERCSASQWQLAGRRAVEGGRAGGRAGLRTAACLRLHMVWVFCRVSTNTSPPTHPQPYANPRPTLPCSQ